MPPEEANLLTVLDIMLKVENDLKNMKSDVEASRLELLQEKDVASSHDNRLNVIEGRSYLICLKGPGQCCTSCR